MIAGGFEDQEEREICGVVFRCTTTQYREIHRAWIKTPEWLAWATMERAISCGEFNATGPAGEAACRRLARAEAALVEATHVLLERLAAEWC